MTQLTSFMINDILSETRHCHSDDVTDYVITGTRRPASQMTPAPDVTASATGDVVSLALQSSSRTCLRQGGEFPWFVTCHTERRAVWKGILVAVFFSVRLRVGCTIVWSGIHECNECIPGVVYTSVTSVYHERLWYNPLIS